MAIANITIPTRVNKIPVDRKKLRNRRYDSKDVLVAPAFFVVAIGRFTYVFFGGSAEAVVGVVSAGGIDSFGIPPLSMDPGSICAAACFITVLGVIIELNPEVGGPPVGGPFVVGGPAGGAIMGGGPRSFSEPTIPFRRVRGVWSIDLDNMMIYDGSMGVARTRKSEPSDRYYVDSDTQRYLLRRVSQGVIGELAQTW
jgi:hypothetical protein